MSWISFHIAIIVLTKYNRLSKSALFDIDNVFQWRLLRSK